MLCLVSTDLIFRAQDTFVRATHYRRPWKTSSNGILTKLLAHKDESTWHLLTQFIITGIEQALHLQTFGYAYIKIHFLQLERKRYSQILK